MNQQVFFVQMRPAALWVPSSPWDPSAYVSAAYPPKDAHALYEGGGSGDVAPDHADSVLAELNNIMSLPKATGAYMGDDFGDSAGPSVTMNVPKKPAAGRSDQPASEVPKTLAGLSLGFQLPSTTFQPGSASVPKLGPKRKGKGRKVAADPAVQGQQLEPHVRQPGCEKNAAIDERKTV